LLPRAGAIFFALKSKKLIISLALPTRYLLFCKKLHYITDQSKTKFKLNLLIPFSQLRLLSFAKHGGEAGWLGLQRVGIMQGDMFYFRIKSWNISFVTTQDTRYAIGYSLL
jgi:hypothetical protein